MDITFRDLVLNAPSEPQSWFKPTMDTPRPEPAAFDEEGYPTNGVELDLWDKERTKQKYIQWPFAWAESVMDYVQVREERHRQDRRKLAGLSNDPDHPQDHR